MGRFLTVLSKNFFLANKFPNFDSAKNRPEIFASSLEIEHSTFLSFSHFTSFYDDFEIWDKFYGQIFNRFVTKFFS